MKLPFYVLEKKECFIVKDPFLKNRTHQTYRWKQYYVCGEKEPLENIINKKQNKEDWRIIQIGGQNEQGTLSSPHGRTGDSKSYAGPLSKL